MSSGFRHGLSSPILHQCQSLFACLRHVPGASMYMGRVLIKFWQFCAPHVRRCDGNPTVGISLAYGQENLYGYFNWRYKYPFEPICLFTFTLKSSCTHILNLVKSSAKLTSPFQHKKPVRGAFPHFCKFSPLSNSYFLYSKFLFLSFLSFLRLSLSFLAVLRDGQIYKVGRVGRGDGEIHH